MTSVFQGLSLSRSVGWVGKNPGNEVARNIVALQVGVYGCPYNHLSDHYVKQQNSFSVASCGSSRISVLLRD